MVKSQPHLSFLFSALSRHNTKPSRKSLRAVDKALCYAKSTVRPLRLHSLKKGERPVLLGWVDASYDRNKKEGRKGMEFQLVGESALAGDITQLDYDNTVMWRSKKEGRKLDSTTVAELLAFKDGCKEIYRYRDFVKSLWGVNPLIVILTDSQPLVFQLRSGLCASEPRFQHELKLVIEMLGELKAETRWVPTSAQHADRQTKFLRV